MLVFGCWYLVVGNIVATYQQSTTKNQKPITDNQTTINVWKTLPSKARVTRDKVSGLQPTSKATVWKTVPIPSD